jgi:hypothetical protein
LNINIFVSVQIIGYNSRGFTIYQSTQNWRSAALISKRLSLRETTQQSRAALYQCPKPWFQRLEEER